jgi:hypothetical protein
MVIPRLKKKNATQDQEDSGNDLLKQSFGKRAKFNFVLDNFPNLDGFLEFYDKDSFPLNKKPFFQTKSTSILTKTSYQYELEHLNYYFREPNPIILFFVNIPKKEIYYIIVSKHYISTVLKINPETYVGDTKTIEFSKLNLFTGDIDKLISDYDDEYLELTQIRQLEASSQGASKNEVSEHKRKVIQMVASEAEKIFMLEALFFFYFPANLTDIDLIKKIADKVGVSGKELDYLLEKMFDSKILNNIKNLVSVQDPKVARKFLDDLITKKGVEYLN